MKEVVFYVEGPSEQEFVKEVLGPYLNDRGIVWRPPILAANSTRKGRVARGGVRSYEPVRKDLLRLFRQFRGDTYIFTTLLDYYGLPEDFPSRNLPLVAGMTPLDRARSIETAWKDDLGDRRFLPNLLLHEFETLVLVRPESLLAPYPDMGQAVAELARSISGFAGPEDINDNPDTAPSKRIRRVFQTYHRRYDKITGGVLAVLELGLETIRADCPKFDAWLGELESRAGEE